MSSVLAKTERQSAAPADLSGATFPCRENQQAVKHALNASGTIYLALHNRKYSSLKKREKIMPVLAAQGREETELTSAYFSEHYGKNLEKEIRRHIFGKHETAILEELRKASLRSECPAGHNDTCLPPDKVLEGLVSGKTSKEFYSAVKAAGALKAGEARIVSERFKLRTGSSLTRTIDEKLGGREEFLARLAKGGAPRTENEAVTAVSRAAHFEKHGLAGFLAWHFSSAGRRLRRNLELAADKSAPAHDSRFRRTVYAEQDLAALTAAKEKTASIMSSVSCGVAATVALGVTAGMPLWICAGTSLVAGIGAYLSSQVLTSGPSYQASDFKKHCLYASIESAFTVGLALPSVIFSTLSGGVMRNGFQQGFRKLAGTAFQNLSSGVVHKTGLFSAVGSIAGNVFVNAFRQVTWRQGIFIGLKTLGESAISGSVKSLTGAAAKKVVTDLVSQKVR